MLTNNQFKQLRILCQNKSSGVIYKILAGLTEFPATVLLANQANKLFDKIMEEHSVDSNSYQYVHAICPFVLNPWDLRDDISVLVCYYKDLGDLTRCPNNIEKIRSIWGGIKACWDNRNISSEPIYNCTICDLTVFTDQQLLRCKHCHWPHHRNCVINEFNNYITLKCHKCRIVLHLQNPDNDRINEYGDMYGC